MGKMDKNVDFLASDIPQVEKNWWPPDFNNLTILRLPLNIPKNSTGNNFKSAFGNTSWIVELATIIASFSLKACRYISKENQKKNKFVSAVQGS